MRQALLKFLAVGWWSIAIIPFSPTPSVASCTLKVKAEEIGNAPIGPALILGDKVTIGRFRLQFLDGTTGKEVRPQEVTVTYGWKWIEYPYPEHAWGAWSDAGDIVQCSANVSEIDVPAYEVRPRGWYNGKYTRFPFPRKPSFDGITVVAAVESCHARDVLRAREAKNLNGKRVVMTINCRGQSRLRVRSD